MTLTAKMIATIFLLVLCSTGSQTQQDCKLSAYAIQFQFKEKPISYSPIYESDLAANRKSFAFAPWGYLKLSSQDDDFISLVKLVVSLNGTEWKTRVSVVKGRFRDKGELEVGTYRSRLDEMVSIDGLKSFGVEPFQLAVVTNRPEVAPRPEVVNKTSSLAVVSLLSSVVPAPYQLQLQNLSHKSVAALEVDAFAGGKLISMISPRGDFNHPLIDGGATYAMAIRSTSGQATAGGAYQRQPDRFEIVTVVFADGTYEGDEYLAAQFNTKIAASKLQLRRVIALLEAASTAETTPVEIISNLSKGTVALSDFPVQREIDPVAARFPSLNVRQRDRLQTSATEGLHAVKASLRFDIDRFRLTETTDPALLKEWLKRMREKYDTWLAGS